MENNFAPLVNATYDLLHLPPSFWRWYSAVGQNWWSGWAGKVLDESERIGDTMKGVSPPFHIARMRNFPEVNNVAYVWKGFRDLYAIHPGCFTRQLREQLLHSFLSSSSTYIVTRLYHNANSLTAVQKPLSSYNDRSLYPTSIRLSAVKQQQWMNTS